MEGKEEVTEGSWTFTKPQKCITSEKHIELFRASSLFRGLIDFLNQLSSPLKGSLLDTTLLSNASPEIQQLTAVLDVMDRWTDEIEPLPGPTRFGNRAFITWMDKLERVR